MAIHLQIRVRGELPDPQAVRAGLAHGVEAWLERVRQTAHARVPKRTGKLAQSLRVVMGRTGRKGQGKNIRGRIVQRFYGAIVEAGAAPHEIRPRAGGLLRFTLAGKTIFTRKVQHPGFAPRPFLRPSAEQHLPDLKATVGDILRRIGERPPGPAHG